MAIELKFEKLGNAIITRNYKKVLDCKKKKEHLFRILEMTGVQNFLVHSSRIVIIVTIWRNLNNSAMFI